MKSNAAETNAASELEQQLVKTINENNLDVPMLPEVARKVIELANDRESDSAALSKLIQSDQTLAAQVMRVANSAIYSPGGGSMASLQQAITRLGMQRISEIALAASIHASLFDAPGYEAHVLNILRHALAAGLWAKEIARAARKNVEAAFLGGLMYDIGRPVALQCIVGLTRSMKLQASATDIYHLEAKYQRQIGLRVVQKWKMPQIVCDVVEHYSDYHQAGSHQLQVMIVVAGAAFADALDISDTKSGKAEQDETTRAESLLTHEVMGELNFYRADIESLLEKAELVKDSILAMSP